VVRVSAGLLASVTVAAVAAAGTGLVLGARHDEGESRSTAQGALRNGAASRWTVLGTWRGEAAYRPTVCDRVAALEGSDRAAGTRRRPFRTVERLVRSLRPGQTGCLRTGNYVGSIEIGRRGTADRPITLQPYPGEAARLVGRLWLNRRSAYVVIRGLYLDGRNRAGLPSPTVNGRHISFANNDVTNGHTAICFVLGHPSYGLAREVTIKGNRIHDCGRLPPTNHDHGVYVGFARDTRIVGNWIHDNADFGVHLYPDARRTLVSGNAIDSNGEGIIFGGGRRNAARDNLVEGNVISNSRLRDNVESHFDGPVGSGNLLRRNCIGGGARGGDAGGILRPTIGFKTVDNVLAVPSFRDADRGDYRLTRPSRCAAVFAGDPNEVPGPLHRPPPVRRDGLPAPPA
jgi:hypothetical protein